MKISYKWLHEYLPVGEPGLPEPIAPSQLSAILTSVGLEVEALGVYENIKGSLAGLIVGKVLSCEQHPNADKLKVTTIDVGANEPLQIVCGAPNVAKGQKVIVAPVGSTIHPVSGEPVMMKTAKIRGVESYGMICAEDEIGLGSNHSGIFILPVQAKIGSPAADHFNVYTDWIYEIGLTPNRMDAMSHIGVARDVCAWLTHHTGHIVRPRLPFVELQQSATENSFHVQIENTKDCKRYSALTVSGVTVNQSPDWLQNRLKSIGQRPINNIVDITNFVLHETGQPLHAFDADEIKSKTIIVTNLAEGTRFVTLDDTERKLSSRDLMICDTHRPVCIAGVFGGAHSGVSDKTKNIFLESAWFSPSTVRQTSFRHGLRTEAAVHFEKGVDVSGTVRALARAGQLIEEIAGGNITGNIIDVYPSEEKKAQVVLKHDYLKKLSGKTYPIPVVKTILSSLEFELVSETVDALEVAVPLSKMDITIPADVVEEIVRIDGLDSIEIPASITISPALEDDPAGEKLKEKFSTLLTGIGFNEIITNSITNSKNFSEETLAGSVKLLNNLSADLDLLRPSMLETGLEMIAYNINRKSHDLRFFEFGTTYKNLDDSYAEKQNFSFWLTCKNAGGDWKHNSYMPDFFTAKGIVESLLRSVNVKDVQFAAPEIFEKGIFQTIYRGEHGLGMILQADPAFLQRFDIRQPVVYGELNYEAVLKEAGKETITFREIPQFPTVERDLAVVLQKNIAFQKIEKSLKNMSIPFLQQFHLFDIFESDKIGNDKKSLAINFSFLDAEKTLTDQDVEAVMQTIVKKLETDFDAEVRK